MSVRAAERAAAGPARRTKRAPDERRRPRARRRGSSEAFRTLTGFDAKVGAAGLQVAVDGDVQLEELAEALERLLAA